jgi:peptidoglycan/xylan/chitin deacetylase (PgdA/CDA1 family)
MNFPAFGPSVKKILTQERTLFLTFDDGPDVAMTQPVLEVLADEGASATFFMIAERAGVNRPILNQVLRQGHAIGNHSLDHDYRRYLSGRKKLREWIETSEARLREWSGASTVGFRPPAGVCTPPLHQALRDLETPLILWSERFYDTRFAWTQLKADRSATKLTAGSIILLHDVQRAENRDLFLATLRHFIRRCHSEGFSFRALSRELCWR